jgi:cysteine-rich repeat protein
MISHLIRLSIIALGWYLVLPVIMAHSAADFPVSQSTPAASCAVTFGLAEPADLTGLLVDVDYSGAPGSFVGTADQVDCQSHVAGALATFNHIESSSLLKAGLVRLSPFGGSDLFTCTFSATDSLVAGDFVVEAVDASDTSFQSLSPAPPVAITAIDCGDTAPDGGLTPTPGDDGKGGNLPPTGSVCDGPFDVTFVVDANAAIGSFHLSVEYPTALGTFAGDGDAVDCTAIGKAEGAVAAFNDDASSGILEAGFLSVAGIQAPSKLMRCRFESVGREPDVSDFVITVVDATTPLVAPIVPLPEVRIASILPASDSTSCTFCGNGRVDPGEECDDGNESNDDACSNDCRAAVCGDGIVNVGVEECDDGAENSDVRPDACRTDCKRAACGDGVVDSSEECDDGNPSNADACLTSCRAATCGDGYVQAGVEQCDDGGANSDGTSNACRSDCTKASCGDGILDSGEACDDGNRIDTDACIEGCVAATCGDGYVEAGVEECDDAADNNDANPEGCTSTCELPDVCGDADDNGLVTATDAKIILDVATGVSTTCARSRCAVDGSADVTASDARAVLASAVGLDSDLSCFLPVVISVDDAVDLGTLQFVVDYSATGSTFIGAGDAVWCASMLDDGALVSFNNDTVNEQLVVAIASAGGIQGPAPVVACSFRQRDTDVAPDDFTVDVVVATDPQFQPVDDLGLSIDF